jgi:hypothetical protein
VTTNSCAGLSAVVTVLRECGEVGEKGFAQNQALERMNRAGAAQRLAVSIAQDIVSASVVGTDGFANEFANSAWCEASLLNESKIQGKSRLRHGGCHERSM